MPKYLVQFGTDSAEVEAATPDDAWAAFCAKHSVAMKHPNLCPRSITEVVPRPAAEVVPEPAVIEHHPEPCPVAPVQESETYVDFVEHEIEVVEPAAVEAEPSTDDEPVSAVSVEQAIDEAVEQAIEQLVQAGFKSEDS